MVLVIMASVWTIEPGHMCLIAMIYATILTLRYTSRVGGGL